MTANPMWDHNHPFPITIHCGACGSTDVRRDAWAEWDDEQQRWVLGQVFDFGYCCDCEGEASLIERNAETGEGV
jgi:hypothetical protein